MSALAQAESSSLTLLALGDWPRAAAALLRRQGPCVRVVVAVVRGSAPREPGACMLVGADSLLGTIGGGHLEWQALQTARALLDSPRAPLARLQRYVLGTELGQCCGGVVELWFERYERDDIAWLDDLTMALHEQGALELRSRLQRGAVRRDWQAAAANDAGAAVLSRHDDGVELRERLATGAPLWLYGAGHVGQALSRIVAELPLRLTWVDARAELFPPMLAGSTRVWVADDPLATVARAPAGARFLVMTHDHELDYQLCRAILARDDFAFAGLIGSKSKAARFRSRLARDGVAPERIARLTCPVGLGASRSKWPAAIAVSIAAQLLDTLPEPPARKPAPDDCASNPDHTGCSGCAAKRSAS
ncbi:xanthine dehydrogenase accessory protein XdhC [Solimonas marina]|uniref:Xanthine dehydrogenase accessory protein XdhC n=1 Tax=Solimonas marina TaxID=2714601 RepID=A0A969WDK4_9GAMM|nr:xanthine dehydrogenase accessory protein XdhC [Solimonas marina]NKF24244.1 xanthine dehydrogenase accessory protein XdhC [Solimonas marina]